MKTASAPPPGAGDLIFCFGRVMAVFCCMLLVSATTLAEPLDDLFLPSELKVQKNSQVMSFTTLSNEDLATRAHQLRDSNISPSQRALNYQWLSQESGNEEAVNGSKALSKLAERQLKAYLDEKEGTIWLKEKLMPDTDGRGFIKSVDYDLKLRSNQFVIGLSYEF
ncbi:MAG: hypothetical protein AB7U63_11685 [Porticoccaceae bacterium]